MRVGGVAGGLFLPFGVSLVGQKTVLAVGASPRHPSARRIPPKPSFGVRCSLAVGSLRRALRRENKSQEVTALGTHWQMTVMPTSSK